MTNQTRTLISIVSAAIIVLGVGCTSDKGKKKTEAYQDPFFPARGTTPALETMMKKQHAIAAAEDGMLFDIHFDGAELNSLGQQKLDAMVAGKSKNTPLKVYLNMPKDAEYTAARQTSVESSMRAAGLETAQFALAVGHNPASMRPAVAGVRALDLQRSTEGNASASSESTNLPVMPGQ